MLQCQNKLNFTADSPVLISAKFSFEKKRNTAAFQFQKVLKFFGQNADYLVKSTQEKTF